MAWEYRGQESRGQARISTAADRPTIKWCLSLNLLLAFFFGPLGLHRFYLGRTGSGIVMLVLSLTVAGLMVTVPWALMDTIRYLLMSDREFAERYARW